MQLIFQLIVLVRIIPSLTIKFRANISQEQASDHLNKMSSTPPIWDFNNYRGYGYSHFPRNDNLSASSDITAESNQNWFPFAYDRSVHFNYLALY